MLAAPWGHGSLLPKNLQINVMRNPKLITRWRAKASLALLAAIPLAASPLAAVEVESFTEPTEFAVEPDNTFSIPYTLQGADTNVLVVGIYIDVGDASQANSMQFGGVEADAIIASQRGTLAYFADPSGADITGTTNANGFIEAYVVWELSGVDLQKAVDSAIGGDASLEITTTSDDMFIVSYASRNNQTVSMDPDADSVIIKRAGAQVSGGSGGHLAMGDAEAPSAGTYPLGWTESVGNNYSELAFAFGNIPTVPFFQSDNPVVVVNGAAGADFHTVTAQDPGEGNLTFTISGGDDASDFEITPEGVMTYIGDDPGAQNFDFAAPTDTDSNNSYQVQITATSDVTGPGVQDLVVTVIENAPPTVTAANISATGATGVGGAFIAGDTITATWDNSATGDNNDGVTDVTIDFSQFGGPADAAASQSNGIWSASYDLVANGIDDTTADVSVTAVNPTGPTTVEDDEDLTVDIQVPVVSDGAIAIASTGSGLDGEFVNGDPVTVQWDNSGAGDANADIASVTVDFSALGGPADAPATDIGGGIYEASYTIDENSIEGPDGVVIVTATDDAGNVTTTQDADLIAVLVPDVVVSEVTGVTDEADPAATASYTIALDTVPTGDVEFTVTADGQTEVSVDGANFAGSQVFSLNDTTPQTITIRAVDDSVSEGPLASTITNALTNSADTTNYPVDLPVDDVQVTVLDDELALQFHPLVLVDNETTLDATFTQATGYDDATWVVIGWADEENTPVIEVQLDGVTVTDNIYSDVFDPGGTGSSVGLWYVQLPSFAAGDHTVSVTTDAAVTDAGASVWVVNGPTGVSDAAFRTYLDDDNGGGGGTAGTIGFNGASTLVANTSSSSDFSAVKAGDFVVAMVQCGATGDRVSGATGWSLVEEDVQINGASYSSVQGAATTDAAALGVDFFNGYFRNGIAALALSFGEQPTTGFEDWIDGFAGVPADQKGFADNPDGDAPNGAEWPLNGDPSAFDKGLVTATFSNVDGLVINFARRQDSMDSVGLEIVYGGDLPPTGASIPVGASSSSGADWAVDVVQDGVETGVDAVTVTIDASAAVDGDLFAQLIATEL